MKNSEPYCRHLNEATGFVYEPEGYLVDMEPDRSLLDRIALLDDLQELLDRKVDLVTERSLYWLLRRRILKEAKPL